MLEKIEKISSILKGIDPNIELGIEERDDGSITVYGPFPSFIMLLEPEQPIRFLIHVNADAPNMVYYMNKILAEVPMIHDGAFAIDQATSMVVLGEDSYKKKEDNILMFARDILARRQEAKANALYVPEEKKLILSGQ